MTIEEKINYLVARYCRNRSHLAELIGVSPQAVNNWVYRDRIPRRGIEAIMAKFPQVDREWLSGGSMPLSSGTLPLPAEENEETPPPGTLLDAKQKTEDHPVDSMPSFITDTHTTLGDEPQTGIREGLVPVKMPRRDIKYVFLCHGDSMLPRIKDGDYVCVGDAIGRYEDFQQGLPYLVQTTDGRLMVKKVQDPGPSSPYLLLSAENPNYQLADGGRLAKREFYAAYRVIMVMRDI